MIDLFLKLSVRNYIPQCSPASPSAAPSEEGCTDSVRPWLSPGTATSNCSSRERPWPLGAGSRHGAGRAQGGSITPGPSPGLCKRMQALAAEDNGHTWTTDLPEGRLHLWGYTSKVSLPRTAGGMSEILSRGHILPWRLSLLKRFSPIFQEQNNSMIISPPQLLWVTYIIHNYFSTCVFAKQITETMKSNETWYARGH